MFKGYGGKKSQRYLEVLARLEVGEREGAISEDKGRSPQPGASSQAPTSDVQQRSRAFIYDNPPPKLTQTREGLEFRQHNLAGSAHREPWRAHSSKDQVPRAHAEAPRLQGRYGRQ